MLWSENVPDDHILTADETFGPILPLRMFDTISEVIELVNSTPYGLQAGVYTNSLAVTKQFFRCVFIIYSVDQFGV